MRRTGAIAVLGVAITVLGACSTSSADYRREAEKFLESEDLAKEAGYRFSDAVCDEPSSTTTGSEFECAATDNDGDDWVFTVQITGDREITVVSGDVVGSSDSP